MGKSVKVNGGKKRKSIFKRWWFWVLVAVIIAAGSSGSKKDAEEVASVQEDDVLPMTVEISESQMLNNMVESASEWLASALVRECIDESKGANPLAKSIESMELDENDNGTIKVHFYADGEGWVSPTLEESCAKVELDLEITKTGNVCELTKAYIDGQEVNINQIPEGLRDIEMNFDGWKDEYKDDEYAHYVFVD